MLSRRASVRAAIEPALTGVTTLCMADIHCH
ncbi:Ms4533A family Cys-rich leader peptide [Streptomyces sp. NPDC002088]